MRKYFNFLFVALFLCLTLMLSTSLKAQPACGFNATNDWVCDSTPTGEPFGRTDGTEPSRAQTFNEMPIDPGQPIISPPPPYVPTEPLPWIPRTPVIIIPEPPPPPQPPIPTPPTEPWTGCDPSASVYENARSLLREREGYRNAVYLDSRGFPTVGIGHLIRPEDNLSMGDTISDERVEELFRQDFESHGAIAGRWSDAMGLTGQCVCLEAVLYSVAFQFPGFEGTSAYRAMVAGDYRLAAERVRTFAWHRQTPKRTNDLIRELEAAANGTCGAGPEEPGEMCPTTEDCQTMQMTHNHTGQTLNVDVTDPANSETLQNFFSDHRAGGHRAANGFDPNTIALLAEVRCAVERRNPGSNIVVNITSGTREINRNRSIGSSDNSMHVHGKAIDFTLTDTNGGGQISGDEVGGVAWCFQRGGVGYYGSGGFTHIDTGGIRQWGGGGFSTSSPYCQGVTAGECPPGGGTPMPSPSANGTPQGFNATGGMSGMDTNMTQGLTGATGVQSVLGGTAGGVLGNLDGLSSTIGGLPNLQQGLDGMLNIGQFADIGNMQNVMDTIGNLGDLSSALSTIGAGGGGLGNTLSQLSGNLSGLSNITSQLGDLTQTLDQLGDFQTMLGDMSSISDITSALGNMGNMTDLRDQLSGLSEMVSFAEELSELGDIGQALSGMGSLADIGTTLNDAISSIEQFDSLGGQLEGALSGIGIPDVQDLSGSIGQLTSQVSQMADINQQVNDMMAQVSSMQDALAAGTIPGVNVADIQGQIDSLTQSLSVVDDVQANLGVGRLTQNTAAMVQNNVGDLTNIGDISNLAGSLDDVTSQISSLQSVISIP
jgi:uncharacterized protein YcbK (DUF882 family)